MLVLGLKLVQNKCKIIISMGLAQISEGKLSLTITDS